MCVAVLPIAVRADDSSCENESNDAINQTLGLCSTHAYNAGWGQNNDDYSAQQKLADIIALKTTVITQQMKIQYDMLEAIEKRLKTQMEKAILTAKAEAAGAPAGGSGSSSSSSSANRNTGQFLPNTENCENRGSALEILKCVQSNLNIAANSNDRANVMKQLDHERDVLSRWGDSKILDNAKIGDKSDWEQTCKSTNPTDQQKCIQQLRSVVINSIDEKSKPVPTKG